MHFTLEKGPNGTQRVRPRSSPVSNISLRLQFCNVSYTFCKVTLCFALQVFCFQKARAWLAPDIQHVQPRESLSLAFNQNLLALAILHTLMKYFQCSVWDQLNKNIVFETLGYSWGGESFHRYFKFCFVLYFEMTLLATIYIHCCLIFKKFWSQVQRIALGW